MIGEGRVPDALALLRTEMAPRSDDPAALHRLASLVFLREGRDSADAREERKEVMRKVQEELPCSVAPPPQRLEELLMQAAAFQSGGGQAESELPKGFSFL